MNNSNNNNNNNEGPQVNIHPDGLKATLKNIKREKPGLDGIHLLPKSINAYRKLSTGMDDQREDNSNPKRPPQNNHLNNYRPITPLPIMCKILTAQIRENYYSLVSHGIFPEEQRGCCKRTRGTEELLYIDQRILN